MTLCWPVHNLYKAPHCISLTPVESTNTCHKAAPCKWSYLSLSCGHKWPYARFDFLRTSDSHKVRCLHNAGARPCIVQAIPLCSYAGKSISLHLTSCATVSAQMLTCCYSIIHAMQHVQSEQRDQEGQPSSTTRPTRNRPPDE